MHQMSSFENCAKSCAMNRADSLLRPLIIDLGIEGAVRLDEIKRSWNTLFREPLSFHMTPAAFSSGELLIIVDSPVWLQELKFYKEDITGKLNHYGVKTVRFRLGRISDAAKSGPASRKAKVKKITETGHLFIRKAVADIHDEGLKETLKAVMVKALSSGKTKIN
jgi:hypothetical protein